MFETAFLILIFCAIIALVLRRKPFTPPRTAPSDARVYAAYEGVESLFVNGAERVFFHAVNHVLPQGYHLHSKVRLEDIVRVRRGITGEAQWRLRGRVKSRHVDYLITDGQGTPRLVIELDGASHNRKAQNANNLKDGIFRAVGIRLIRVKTGENVSRAVERIMAFIPQP